MKKFILAGALIFPLVAAIACKKKTTHPTKPHTNNARCGTKDGNTLYKDDQRNCYYLNESGLKEYVENSACSCMY
ncbi:MAG: hypothetical protein ABIP51_00900 [Bacteroidia bacterium]